MLASFCASDVRSREITFVANVYFLTTFALESIFILIANIIDPEAFNTPQELGVSIDIDFWVISNHICESLSRQSKFLIASSFMSTIEALSTKLFITIRV